MVAAFLTVVHVSGLYIHCDCLLSDFLVRHGSVMLSSNYNYLKFLA